MVIKRKDFQKAAAFIHEFLLKLNDDVECAEVRDTLNLALLHMQKYYRIIQNRSQEKCNTLSLTARGLSPMTPFVDAPDKFLWRWINLDTNTRISGTMNLGDSLSFVILPPLIEAAKKGDISEMSDLIHQDPSCADAIDGLGRNGVTYAVHFFQHDALKFLLEQQTDVNAQAHDGSTALHRACHDSNHVALELLLQYGGDLTISDVQGRLPIHWAVTTRSTDCLKLLLAQNASAGARDKDGMTASMWACRMDNFNHFELLCHADNVIEEADGIERDLNGRTWMHWAVRRTEPLECLQTLLTEDTAAIKDEEGKTVLLLAAEMGSLPACKLIVQIAGEQVTNDQDSQGRTALHLATMGGHGDVVNFLLDKSADVTLVDNFNATSWDYARIRKLHYCQLIIMSHQRQRLTSNPNSPMPNGLGLLLKEESGVRDDFSRMSFKSRSNISTPITPPHPPKRPRTSRMLARRANSLTTADREHSRDAKRLSLTQDRSISVGDERKNERISINVNTSSKRMATGDGFMNSREETMMTESSRPMFEDENDEISVGGMDVSDIEDGDEKNNDDNSFQTAPTPRPRPPPRPRLSSSEDTNELSMGREMSRSIENLNTNNNSIRSHLNQLQHKQQENRTIAPNQMDFEDVASGPSPRAMELPRAPSSRPQARVPPTPMYRPQRAPPPAPFPPPTNQRPQMIRHVQPLPPSNQPQKQTKQPQQQTKQPQQRQQRETTPPSLNDPPSPLSSQSSDPHSKGQGQTQTQGDRPNSGGSQPPGVLEGRRIPPPALTPLSNAPKPPTMDSFDKMDKKKKKKKKDRKEDPPQNPSDIPPPRGFAAPLHPPNQQQSRINSAAPPQPRFSRGNPQHSESRYIDENMDGDKEPPSVSGFAVQIRDGATKSARPGLRSSAVEEESMDLKASTEPENGPAPIAETDEDGPGDLIPPPAPFRSKLAQSVPQDNKSARLIPTSAKPPLPKNRSSLNSASPRHNPRPTGKSANPRKTRPPTSKGGN